MSVRPESGGYSFDFAAADQACQGLGGRLSSYSEMEAAYLAGSLHVGQCSFVSNGYAYYALQYTVHGNGWQGIHLCSWDTQWDAFCYIPGP